MDAIAVASEDFGYKMFLVFGSLPGCLVVLEQPAYKTVASCDQRAQLCFLYHCQSAFCKCQNWTLFML